MKSVTNKTFLSSEHMEDAKAFQLNLGKRLGMNLLGLDFLLTSDGTLIPVDLNKVPRINRMTNISKILARSLVSKQGIPVVTSSPMIKPS